MELKSKQPPQPVGCVVPFQLIFNKIFYYYLLRSLRLTKCYKMDCILVKCRGLSNFSRYVIKFKKFFFMCKFLSCAIFTMPFLKVSRT
jgi:hypothetical protein